MVRANKFQDAVAARKSLLAKVHIARKQLGLTEEEYRAMLEASYDRSSAGDLTVPQLTDLVGRLEGLGFRAGPRSARSRAPQGEYLRIPDEDVHAAQKRYILALAKKLGWSPQSLNGRIAKQFGVQRIEWLHDQAALQTLAKDLYSRCKKRGLDPRAS